MHDDYADQRHASHDVTDLEVLAPEEYAGRFVSVMHSVEPPQQSPWTDVGATYDTEIDPKYLRSGSFPGVGAFGEIKKVAEAEQ
jgi:hypothetical protein